MEIAFSAFLGEIAHRSVSFFLEKLFKEAAALPIHENLRRKLLRIHVIVEEAEGRQIRNQAMLEQLKVIRESMYRGYYMLDTFKCQAYKENSSKADHRASYSFALSKFNPAKRLQLCKGSIQGEKELHQVLGSLEVLITDVSEFVLFLTSCPPLYRQLYSTYLVSQKCMFGRHAEVEYIISFLMPNETPGAANLDVLPIVGPAKAGKSTLIEHVCNDERVRNTFSQILLFREDSLDGRLTSVRDGGTVKHKNHAPNTERFLVIVEIDGDMEEGTWSRLYSASKRCSENCTKIIISSRSDRIARFGTTRAVKVEYLRQEEYWYFFKSLAFGSTDPEEEPKLAAMALQMALYLNGSFIAGNIVASMLRANFSVKFWRIVLSCVKEVSQRYSFIFGAHPVSPWQNTKQAYVPRINGSNGYCSVYNDYQIVSAQDETQMITFQEILSGGVLPYGKFEVLAWRSCIPPYYSYIFSCEIHKAPEQDVQKKRTRKAAIDDSFPFCVLGRQ
ncbi:unnamed protein product [Urochloa decumbens]|uniref:Disease resistance N-terminal domain-containing protein n=1 Tax=Urochloa decumbens TaxID=240449 RepID=A0ABC9GB11_9POAL